MAMTYRELNRIALEKSNVSLHVAAYSLNEAGKRLPWFDDEYFGPDGDVGPDEDDRLMESWEVVKAIAKKRCGCRSCC